MVISPSQQSVEMFWAVNQQNGRSESEMVEIVCIATTHTHTQGGRIAINGKDWQRIELKASSGWKKRRSHTQVAYSQSDYKLNIQMRLILMRSFRKNDGIFPQQTKTIKKSLIGNKNTTLAANSFQILARKLFLLSLVVLFVAGRKQNKKCRLIRLICHFIDTFGRVNNLQNIFFVSFFWGLDQILSFFI